MRQRQRIAGQTSTETIVMLILIALAIVLAVGFYGRTVMKAFSCAAESLADGRLSFSCPAGTNDDESGGGAPSEDTGSGGGGGDAADGSGEDAKPEPVDGAEPDGAPAPSGSPSSGGASGAQKKLEEAKDLLKSTPKGKEILDFLADKGVAIELKGGDGSVYDKKNNKIIVNDAKSADAMALTIAHEANHTKFDKEGRSADIDKDSRDDYVNKMIEEEAVGTVASIEMKKDLQAAGKTITASYPLEREFNAASKKAIDDLKKANPKATAAELDAAGKQAGLDAVRSGFKTGKVLTSNTKETYPDYYGKAHDKRRAKPGSPEAAAPEPLQPFEVIDKKPKTGFEKLGGQIDRKELRDVEAFTNLGNVTE
ncbi:MAG: DUF6782 family putative metallopeptidase, partial [Candidatus Binatia bacterium]